MHYTVPHYYRQFSCIAGDCPDTCCAGWQIVIDEKSREKYRRYQGPFGNRLYNSIDWKESSFCQYDGRCAFLNEENLCDLYSEAGKDMLCKTCREYPRHTEEFEGIREISLSLSCPEAARLILSCKEPVRFLTKEREGEETYEDFDFFLYTKLADARDGMISILQDRRVPIRVRMGAVLALGHDLQRRIDREELFSVDQLLERYLRDGAMERLERKLEAYRILGQERARLMQELFGLLDELEVLKADWPEYVAERKAALFGEGAGEKFSEPGAVSQWEIWLEQLMVYFVFTYFCGAVYDGRAYEKIKLAVVSTLLIGKLTAAQRMLRGEAETAKQEDDEAATKRAESAEADAELTDIIETAYRYSKEAEHSDLNLHRLEELFRERECCGLENLLRIVMS